MNVSIVTVKLWGTVVGYLGYEPGQKEIVTFEFDTAFMRSGIQLSPLMMSYPPAKHSFSHISFRTFHGLAGVFADSLPDKFGTQLIDRYFADKGIASSDITALDRLCYIGNRSMGAFEYEPAQENATAMDGGALNIHLLNELANLVLMNKDEFAKKLSDAKTRRDIIAIIRVGSSAGGARSKALVALDKEGRFFDGTVDSHSDKTYWLLKFDSSSNEDKEGKDPKGMTRIEYIYSLLAPMCGIDIPQTQYIIDGDDFHYMIKRFDRVVENGKVQKIHYSSWAGLNHYDRDNTGVYSYEQLVLTCRQLGLGQDTLTQVFRRAVFNIIGRNQDDHAKNFGFLMNKRGEWSLSPAFDMTYAYDPLGKWTSVHQIVLNGKQDEFSRQDLLDFAKKCNIKPTVANMIINSTIKAFGTFFDKATQYGVPDELRDQIESSLRHKRLDLE